MAVLSSSLPLLLLLAAAGTTGANPQHFDPRDVSPRHNLRHSNPASSSLLESLSVRAEPEAPDGYTPQAVTCPDTRPSIRSGTLSQQERDWVQLRRNTTAPLIRDLIGRLDISGFNSTEYFANVTGNSTAMPNIGLAISGGGYRAMLTGAGALAAWDSRSAGSEEEGNLGGLLQSATYISALSGGGWLVGSLYANNFTSVQDAVASPVIWQFDASILEGPEQYSLRGYYKEIFDDVEGKTSAGYDDSITDYWGRMLSYQLVNATSGGPSYTFSSIADDQGFSTAQVPLPFLIADGRNFTGEVLAPTNSTVFEFSPWEFGSSDPSIRGFAPLRYVGSNFSDGALPQGQDCVAGFDNVGFVMGTSSSLFNTIVLYLNQPGSSYVPSDVPGFVIDALTAVLNSIGDDDNDIAEWTPNPFKGFNTANNTRHASRELMLVDGGEDLQNVPYHPHTLIERAVDVVFSIDSSADTDSGWPDGASAMSTYQRSQSPISDGTSFPPVPDTNTFRNLGLNTRPTFFGCNASNMSDPTPLVVYLPNYPYLFQSNISTFQMTLNNSERDAIVQNGWAVATQLNSTRDQEWPACVACAIMARSFDRTNTTVPATCTRCFDRYCWNGTTDTSEPQAYFPQTYTTPIDVQSGAAILRGGRMAALTATLGASLVAGLMVIAF